MLVNPMRCRSPGESLKTWSVREKLMWSVTAICNCGLAITVTCCDPSGSKGGSSAILYNHNEPD